jgi:hypothetical protein
MPPEQTLAELVAEARYANDRVALYRQRLYRGNGDPRRLAELERIAAGARERLALHRVDAHHTGRGDLAGALREVGERLDAPGLSSPDRIRLLQRQAELGDLRDELDLRARRRTGERSHGRRGR